MPIYVAPIGSEGLVEYVAELHELHLRPEYGQARTTELLRKSLPSTSDEGLWEKYDKTVRTLYAMSNCRKLVLPVSMTGLIKVSDDKPISKDYGYSYSLVYATDLATMASEQGAQPDREQAGELSSS